MNTAKEGIRWAITWDGDPDSNFVLEFPAGVNADDNTPPQARLMAAVNTLMNNDDNFVEGIMDWFEEDFGRWKKAKLSR